MEKSHLSNQDIYPTGPEKAESELRQAYNHVVECCVVLQDRGTPLLSDASVLSLDEVIHTYQHGFNCHRSGNRLAAERWARSTKHLAWALWHEAKIAHLERHSSDIPFLHGATAEDYNLHEHSDTAEDLLASVANHIPAQPEEAHHKMQRFLLRAKEHLDTLKQPEYRHELLRAERIKAAYEYGRAIECLALALEAEKAKKAA